MGGVVLLDLLSSTGGVLVGTPIEITVYKVGNKYMGEPSNDSGMPTMRSYRRWRS
jgi:hypothetical protein